MALDISEEAQKRVLLLHYAGPDVYDIFNMLPDTGDTGDCDTVVEKLQAYFCPKVNNEYEIYVFRQARQNEN